MKVTLAQIEVEASEVDANRERAVNAIRTAATESDLVILPELFTVGYFAFDSYARQAQGLDGETLSAIAAVADEEDVAVVAGTIVEDLAVTAGSAPVPAEEGLANTAVVFDSDGQRQLVYRKHHLFGYGSAEQDLLVPGDRVETAEVAGLTLGVTTCYDVRFPELYRELVEQGAELIAVPSAWPYPRVEHWQLLPRARAVENLVYVAAANGVGTFDTSTLLGRSTVYDPWGTVLADSDDDPALVTAEVDPETVAATREEFPALSDRRTAESR